MTVHDTANSAVSHEGARKGLHLATGVIPLVYAAGLPRTAVVAGLGVLLAVAVVVEVARRWSPTTSARFLAYTGSMLRASESAGAVTGATWMLVGYLLAVIVAPRDAAVVAMWAVAAGDGVATLVGRRFGTGPAKSNAGSLAMALAVTAGGYWLGHLSVPWSLGVAAAATLAERGPPIGNDNLRIPAAVLGVLSLR
jgi:dolichol kinase